MKLTNLRPTIWTEHLHETVNFYVQVLGFTCWELNEEWRWASLGKDEVELMISTPDRSEYDKIGFSGSLYFNTDDVDSLWLQLKDRATISYQLETFDWGMREFGIYDNNGYLLQFGQEVEG